MALKILLLEDLPIGKEHGAVEGRVFDCIGISESRNKLAYFIGDAGERNVALIKIVSVSYQTSKDNNSLKSDRQKPPAV